MNILENPNNYNYYIMNTNMWPQEGAKDANSGFDPVFGGPSVNNLSGYTGILSERPD